MRPPVIVLARTTRYSTCSCSCWGRARRLQAWCACAWVRGDKRCGPCARCVAGQSAVLHRHHSHKLPRRRTNVVVVIDACERKYGIEQQRAKGSNAMGTINRAESTPEAPQASRLLPLTAVIAGGDAGSHQIVIGGERQPVAARARPVRAAVQETVVVARALQRMGHARVTGDCAGSGGLRGQRGSGAGAVGTGVGGA